MSSYQTDKSKLFNWVMVTAASCVIALLYSINTKMNQLVTENAVKTEQVNSLRERVDHIEQRIFLKPKETTLR